MKRELVIEQFSGWTRAALFEDGQLCEVHQEKLSAAKQTDRLYLGRVQAIRPAVGAAFVDVGLPLNAFLPIREGHGLRAGDLIIVQGTAVQTTQTKGLRVSDTINLAGKWLVLVPGAQGVRLSKKIKDPALRDVLREAVLPLCPADCGLIVRTASGDVTQEALASETEALDAFWRSIRMKAKGMTKPGVLHEPLSLPLQLARDIGGTLSRVVTNRPDCFAQMCEAKAQNWFASDTRIEHFEEKSQLLADVYALDSLIDKALRRRVWLDCGGYLVIDTCEALTVIDVNSGKMTLGKDAEDTALRVNLEAAQEIARQLRLRDIGGIVIVDYIDMRETAHREQLLAHVRKAEAWDRAQVHVEGMTRLGLVEMTRKRKGERLDQVMQTACRTCGGDGHFLAAEEIALRALRQVRRMALSGQRGPFLIACAGSVAHALAGMAPPVSHAAVYAFAESGKHAERFEIKQLEAAAAPPKGTVQLNMGVIYEENAGH